MGYTTPGTNKLSLGVDTSAESLKKDVKKNLAKKSGLGVDMTIDTDTSKSAAAVKKAINAPTDTRENQAIQDTKNAMDASKLKNISRGSYVESSTPGTISTTTSEGSIKKGETLNPVTKTETWGLTTGPGGGSGFIPEGKGSYSESYSYTPEEAPGRYGKRTIEAGDYQGYVAPEKTGKQKRQAKRKTKQTARLKKQGERTDAKIMKNNPEYKGLSY